MDEWLGYYPASLFTLLNTGACRASWYVEVFNPKPGTAIDTEAGSGKHGLTGQPLLAAYVRAPEYFDPYYWYPVPVEAGTSTTKMGGEVEACYSSGNFADGMIYLGGDGKCTWPSQ